MPLPMVHFAVAVQLTPDQLPSADFLLGCLAPDAIHMRPGSTRADKRATHLFMDEGEPEDDPRVARFAEEMIERNPGAKDFSLGYAVHLWTDRRWYHQLAAPFFASLPEEFTSQERRSHYYLETDQVDFNLYNRQSWRPMLWNKLGEALPPDYSPVLSADEIRGWQQRTLNWFGGLKQEPRIQPVFFTDEKVAGFIHNSAQAIVELLQSVKR